jgi:hypothetical protein
MVSKAQRAALKREPLGGIFTQLRYWKRRLQSQPLNGDYEWNLLPCPRLSVDQRRSALHARHAGGHIAPGKVPPV